MQWDAYFWAVWNALLGLGIVMIVFLVIVILLIVFIIGALFLWLGLKAVDSRDDTFGNVCVTQILNIVLGLIPCIGCFLQWYAIKERHDTSWGGAIAAWLLSLIIPIVIIVAISYFFGIWGTIWGAIAGLIGP